MKKRADKGNGKQAGATNGHGAPAATDGVQRAVLPIPDRQTVGITTYDAKDPNTKYPPITPLRPPTGAPNVLVFLIDDVGFGASTAFGGPCNMPTAERLAAGGLKYTRFHTTALCAPTRAAMLCGRNHHSVGMGAITEMATSAPGNCSVRPKNKAPLAEILKLNGYSTAQLGKCHEVPTWETSPVGPFDRWPTGSGFEYFYGFVGGEANQYYPGLFEGTTAVEPPKTPEQGYTLNEDLGDRAVRWLRQQKSLTPDKPFFMYYAPGATHAPHHVPKEWSDKYKGKFDGGWDKQREATFARQQQLGVIPKDAELTPRPKQIPAWDDMPAEMKPILARQMEIYAGFLEQTDHHIGRVVAALEELGSLDDTLIYVVIGDNGASAEDRDGLAAGLPDPHHDRRAAVRDRHRRHGPPRAAQRAGDERAGGRGRGGRGHPAAGQDRHDHPGQPAGQRVHPGRRRGRGRPGGRRAAVQPGRRDARRTIGGGVRQDPVRAAGAPGRRVGARALGGVHRADPDVRGGPQRERRRPAGTQGCRHGRDEVGPRQRRPPHRATSARSWTASPPPAAPRWSSPSASTGSPPARSA